MRPGFVRAHPYDPPRWRRRRSSDLRDIAVAYAIAIIGCLAVIAASSIAPHWVFNGDDRAASTLRGVLLIATYLGSGALVVALAVHRMAFWQGTPTQRIPRIRWYTVVIWPVLIGLLLFRLATSRWS